MGSMNVNFISEALHNLRNEFVVRGKDLRAVGGAVRDTLAGSVIKDVDLCTDATPDEQIKIYEELGLRFIPTGLEHGTVSVVLDGEVHEITSLRVDVETDGRHAKVEFTSDWEADLGRRDLTINAMALTFDGVLIDPFGGAADLANGVVRFVGNADARIKEDYLRILRWFRFLGRYGNLDNLDAATVESIKQNVNGLKQISRERVWSEVQRIVAHDRGPALMELMTQVGVANASGLHYGFESPNGVPNAVMRLEHAQQVTRNPEVLMAAWLGWDENETSRLAHNWKWSNVEREHASWIAANMHAERDLRRLIAIDGVKREWVVELAALEQRDGWEQNALAFWEFAPFPVTGNDLIASGVKPGMAMGVMLRDLKEAWFRSGYSASKEELMVNVKKD